jgi:hypothetical protein
MNIYSGETWRSVARERYGSELQGLGLDLEHAPQQAHGVDTLMKVGDYEMLGYTGETVVDFAFSPLIKRGAALAMLYHGYSRTGSLFWGALWAAFGYAVPPAAGVIAYRQGFARKKPSSPAF